eukprot:1160487-Pelagomonas_calceolata.AAC.1
MAMLTLFKEQSAGPVSVWQAQCTSCCWGGSLGWQMHPRKCAALWTPLAQPRCRSDRRVRSGRQRGRQPHCAEQAATHLCWTQARQAAGGLPALASQGQHQHLCAAAAGAAGAAEEEHNA